jgi:hypothetical protein
LGHNLYWNDPDGTITPSPRSDQFEQQCPTAVPLLDNQRLGAFTRTHTTPPPIEPADPDWPSQTP